MKQMLRPQCAHQRILHQIVGGLGGARQRARIAAQRRDRRLDTLTKSVRHSAPSHLCVYENTRSGGIFPDSLIRGASACWPGSPMPLTKAAAPGPERGAGEL